MRGADYRKEDVRMGAIPTWEAAMAEIDRIEAENTRLRAERAKDREALRAIADRHIPDQPMALDMDEAEYVKRQHTELRAMARARLAQEAEDRG